MKYIELTFRRNKISQRWHQRPSHSWGRGAHNGYEGLPCGVRDVQVAGRNIGNILFFQDCGIKYLPRRNKSYVAVRSHLGGNRWIPGSQRYCRSLGAPSGEKQYTEETSDIDVFSAFSVVTFGGNNFYVWILRPDVYPACNLRRRCRNGTLYSLQLFERNKQ